jgi:hypothetical protein
VRGKERVQRREPEDSARTSACPPVPERVTVRLVAKGDPTKIKIARQLGRAVCDNPREHSD